MHLESSSSSFSYSFSSCLVLISKNFRASAMKQINRLPEINESTDGIYKKMEDSMTL